MVELRQTQHTDPTHLSWSPDAKHLAVADRYGDTVIYGINDAEGTTVIARDDTGLVFSIAFHPDGHRIALANHQGVNIYDVETAKRIWHVKTPHYAPSDVVYSQDGRLLFIGCWHEDADPYGSGGALFIYDTTTQQQVYKHIEDEVLVVEIAVDPSNKQFTWQGNDGIVRLCDMSNFSQMARFEPFKVGSPATTFVKFLGSDALFIECCDDYMRKSFLWQPVKKQSHELKQLTDLNTYREHFYRLPLTLINFGEHPHRYQVRDVHSPENVLYACRGSQAGCANHFSNLAIHAESERTAWADASYQSYEKVPRNRLSIYDSLKIIIQFEDLDSD